MAAAEAPSAPAMTLRSSTPFRERWSIPALAGRPEEAAEVAQRLSASGEVERAVANGVTGSVVVEFDESTPRMQVRSLLASTVTAVLERAPKDRSIAPRGPTPTLPGADLLRLTRPHRPTAIAAGMFTVLEKVMHVVTAHFLVVLMNVATGGASAMLASLGFSTTLSQLVIAGVALLAVAGMAWIAHDAHRTLWSNLATSVSKDLERVASDEERALLEGFFANHASGLLGFAAQTSSGAAVTKHVAQRAAVIVFVPAAILGVIAVARPQRSLPPDEDGGMPQGLREYLRPRNLFAIGSVAAAALTAWLAGWITLEMAGILLLFGELLIAPSLHIGAHLLAAREANDAARQLRERNERKVLAITSGE